MKRRNLTGMVRGYWTILEDVEDRIYDERRVRYVRAKCRCGTVRACRADSITSGLSKSCGCHRAERVQAHFAARLA